MNKKALSLAICLAISYPSASLALGLGEIESVSNLNQPFKAKIDLLSVGDTNVGSLKIKVASPSVFSRVGIDRPNFLNGLRFRSTMENGKPVVLVSSSQPIKEPFINFLLEVSWPKGQLLKEYTVLLDPPVLMQANDTSIASNTAGVRPDPSQRQAQIQQRNIAAQQERQRQQQQRVIAQQQKNRQQQASQAQQQQRQRQLQQQRQQAQNDGLRRPSGTGAAPVAQANQSRTYRIRSGDTLYKVAKRLGHNGVRNEQMMMAIYEANPTAFRKRNINNLKSGVTIRRPSINEARRITLSGARQNIRSQTTEWKRSKPTKTQAPAATNNQRASGTARPTNNQARIEVLGSTNGNNSANSGNLVGQAKLNDLNRQMTLASESLTARTRENNDLKSRVSELEALLKKKNRLITLKNEQLAELQVSLGKPPTAMMSPDDADIKGTISEQGVEIEKMVAGQDGNDGTIVRTQDPVNPIINEMGRDTDTEIFQEPVIDEMTAALDSQESAEEEGGILDLLSSPLVMGLGGGSLLALIAGFLFLRRRNSSDEYDDYSPIDFDDPSFAPGSGGFDDASAKVDPVSDADDPFAGLGGSSSPVESNFDIDPMDEMVQEPAAAPKAAVASAAVAATAAAASGGIANADDDDDILQEADVYIVYGLHEQAEVELKRAIEKQPDNLEYRAKLLENYHASDNKEAFEEAATEFSQLNGPGKDALWEKVSGWGGKLLPASPLFASPGVAALINDTSASKPAETFADNTALTDTKEESSGLSGKLGMAAAAAAAGGVAITAGKAFADNTQDKVSGLTDKISGLGDDSALSGLTDKIPGLGGDSEIADIADAKSAEVLDFDDMDLDSLLSADVEAPDVASLGAIEMPKIDTDFEDVDLDSAIKDMAKNEASGLGGGAVAALGGAVALGGAAIAKASSNASDNNEMDFDFSEFEVDGGAAAEKVTSLTEAGSDDFEGLDDFDFGLDDVAEDTKDALGSRNLNLALDGSDTGVGKILPENSVYKMAETKEAKDDVLGGMDDDLSFLDLDNGADTGLMEAQVSTKLDLARAYMDMGDVEGARSTLEEVMTEGNDDQRKEAKKLLHQAG